MAHELWIDTASGTAPMFYVDEDPWHGLGTKLANPATPIRVVCNNTLTMALSEGETIRVPHTQDVHIMLQRTERTLGIINRRYTNISQVFKAMARHQLNQEKVRQYLASVFPAPNDPEDQYGLRRTMEQRALAELLFDQGKGNRMRGVSGTLWAAYNGVTELIDHRRTKQTPDQHLTSIWYGDGYLTKARAYCKATTLLKKAA